MIHTYKKERDGTYAIGQWLVGMLEYRFMPMFYVPDRSHAIAAVRELNGSDGVFPFQVVREEEPKKKSKYTWIWTVALLGAVVGTIYGCTAVKADQRTYYGSDGRVIGRSVTDSQGTRTLYGADGKALTRESPTTGGSTIYDARSGRAIGTTDKRNAK